MSTSPVINALVGKRAEIAGQLDELDRKRSALAADLSAIDTAIAIFDPSIAAAAIKPKRQRPELPARAGETARAIFAYLRQLQRPASTAEITLHIMERRGLDTGDKALVDRMGTRVRGSLEAQRKRGALQSREGPDRLLVWSVRVD